MTLRNPSELPFNTELSAEDALGELGGVTGLSDAELKAAVPELQNTKTKIQFRPMREGQFEIHLVGNSSRSYIVETMNRAPIPGDLPSSGIGIHPLNHDDAADFLPTVN